MASLRSIREGAFAGAERWRGALKKKEEEKNCCTPGFAPGEKPKHGAHPALLPSPSPDALCTVSVPLSTPSFPSVEYYPRCTSSFMKTTIDSVVTSVSIAWGWGRGDETGGRLGPGARRGLAAPPLPAPCRVLPTLLGFYPSFGLCSLSVPCDSRIYFASRIGPNIRRESRPLGQRGTG